ncbi:nucleotide exchange factor GrpE [Aliidiomarina taiwanensis]|uniref:Protein GrpE n=1 Tax=Aliidiomarina taiwanensis TaxID=946228 RepID=A0A432X9D3_9GAMM|nr:nucleotide exchange factor GrpE [Aliidiomarina taiwanensis]RUO43851.1 nucleotide exchange factor GrpE [Aliidiomarina taiwanensis]
MSNPAQPESENADIERTTEEQVEVNETPAAETNQESEQADPEVRIAELEAALAAAQEEVNAQKDKALRIAAEAENVRRRSAQEVEKASNFALEKFAGELLEVIDNLERAIQAIDPEDEAVKALAEGVEITYKGFINTTTKFGIEAVNPEGAPFDPQLHQAMSMQENTEVPPNTVLHVMQKGYLLKGRLLRPAMVMVSRAPTEGVDTKA